MVRLELRASSSPRGDPRPTTFPPPPVKRRWERSPTAPPITGEGGWGVEEAVPRPSPSLPERHRRYRCAPQRPHCTGRGGEGRRGTAGPIATSTESVTGTRTVTNTTTEPIAVSTGPTITGGPITTTTRSISTATEAITAEPNITTEPNTAEPISTTKPNTTEFNTAEPNSAKPNSAEPNTTEFNATESIATTEPNTTTTSGPNTTEPITTEPITSESINTESINTTEPITTEPISTAEPNTTEPNTTEPITTEPISTAEPNTTEPNTTEPITTEPISTAEPNTTEPISTAEPNTTESITTESINTTEPITTKPINTESITTTATEPITTESINTAEPNSTEPITTKSTTEANTTEPLATTEPNTTKPTMLEPNTDERTTTKPTTTTKSTEPITTKPNTTATEPNTTKPTMTEPNTDEPTTTKPTTTTESTEPTTTKPTTTTEPITAAPLQSVRYERGSLWFLNQLLLPRELRYEAVPDVERARAAIAAMEVRGAPAIAVLGALAVAVELRDGRGPRGDAAALRAFVEERMERVKSARPTAANVGREAERLRDAVGRWMETEPGMSEGRLRERIIAHLEGLLQRDVDDNRSIGAHGARHLLRHAPHGAALTLLTHCNTGTLATAGYGTALGIVRALHAEGRVARLYCTETRPYNQGARLTALEMLHDGVPTTLIADSAAAAAMQHCGVHAVVVGADRVAANGDTANKIGTYALAVAAHRHGIPFYVAAPTSSCDATLPHGALIPIEQRPEHELTHVNGVRVAAPGVEVWNPAFDVTPHELITGGIVTERGVFRPAELRHALQRR